MIVVGVDPGRTTGLCVFADGRFTEGREARTYTEVRDYIDYWWPDLTIVEDYKIRPHKGSDYHPPIRMIGAVDFMCEERRLRAMIQSPSATTLTIGMTRGMHKSRHVRSACAHVIYYLKKQGLYAES